LANIALPRLAAPRLGGLKLKALLTHPVVGFAAAAALLVAALVGLAAALGVSGGSGAKVRLPLAEALRHAPSGWRDTLKPLTGAMTITEDVVNLSAKPLGALDGVSWNAPAPVNFAGGGPLPQAPIAGLFTPGPNGPLPIIASDGRTPFQAYKRPFVPDGRPRIAIVVGGLGLNARATHTAIDTLPPEITLSFAPYAEGLQAWVDAARARGHEVLLETPMEPMDFPDNDPGPYALMTEASAPETAHKLEAVLSRTTGYFGLTNYLGSRFLASDAAYQTFAQSVASRGLGFIDDGLASRHPAGGLPRASADRVIDDQLSAGGIEQQLQALEMSANQHGQALGAGFAYPVTLDKVARWAQGLSQRGFQLAPASALAVRR
jgi:polysaccharide deacetylase 2 family uncharacterized protein YibQ